MSIHKTNEIMARRIQNRRDITGGLLAGEIAVTGTGNSTSIVTSDGTTQVTIPNSTQVATAAQGTKADNAVQSVTVNNISATKTGTTINIEADNSPTEGSTKLVTSGGVRTALNSIPTPNNGMLTLSQTGASSVTFGANQNTAASFTVAQPDWNAAANALGSIANKPTIPAAQVNSNWNATSGVAQILNKPSVDTAMQSGSPNLITSGTVYIAINNIAAPNNGTITINQGGTQKGTFTVNQTGNTTVNLDGAGLTQTIGTFSYNSYNLYGPYTGTYYCIGNIVFAHMEGEIYGDGNTIYRITINTTGLPPTNNTIAIFNPNIEGRIPIVLFREDVITLSYSSDIFYDGNILKCSLS